MKHVLVVEDDLALKEIITMLLEMEGYQVTAVETGTAALKLVSESVDVLLLDWRLPDMFGHLLLKQILATLLEVPCILSSAESTASQYARAAGAERFLRKPYDISVLLHLVRTLLNTPQRCRNENEPV